MELMALDTWIQGGGLGIAIFMTSMFYKSSKDRSLEYKDTQTLLVDLVERSIVSDNRNTNATNKMCRTLDELKKSLIKSRK